MKLIKVPPKSISFLNSILNQIENEQIIDLLKNEP